MNFLKYYFVLQMLVSHHHPECNFFTVQIKVTLRTFNFPGTL